MDGNIGPQGLEATSGAEARIPFVRFTAPFGFAQGRLKAEIVPFPNSLLARAVAVENQTARTVPTGLSSIFWAYPGLTA